jgi:hypothetical protein
MKEEDFIDFNDLAKISVQMAKKVDSARPEVVALALRSGVVAGNMTMEALRSVVGVKTEEYDPAIFHVVLKYNKAQEESRCQMNQLHQTLSNKDFRKIYPDFKKLMIIDYTICGDSVSSYLCAVKNQLPKFGKVYVNLMAACNNYRQESEFKAYDHFNNHNLQIEFSRLKDPHILFDDEDSMIGLSFTNSFDYMPVIGEESKTFYGKFKKALDNIKG